MDEEESHLYLERKQADMDIKDYLDTFKEHEVCGKEIIQHSGTYGSLIVADWVLHCVLPEGHPGLCSSVVPKDNPWLVE